MHSSWQLRLWAEVVLRLLNIIVGLRVKLNKVHMNGNIELGLLNPYYKGGHYLKAQPLAMSLQKGRIGSLGLAETNYYI